MKRLRERNRFGNAGTRRTCRWFSPTRLAALGRRSSVAGRTGSTLTEVLMAVLVMGIGLFSVITLFPLSLVRSLQATNLTHATIQRYNAETQIMADRRIVHRPEDPPRGTLPAPLPIGGAESVFWERGAGVLRGRYLVDPRGWFEYNASGPFGYDNDFGGAVGLARFPANMLASNTAEATVLTSLPDSFVKQADGVVTTSTATSATFASDVDLSGLSVPGPPDSRVILFDESGRQSYTRQLDTAVLALGVYTVNWTLPIAGGVPFVPTTAVVQTEEPGRYSWMLGVRKDTLGDAQIDIVIFFRRTFDTNEETVHTATLDPTDLSYRSYLITYPPDDETYWRRGGFLLDVVNVRWYRIQEVEDTAPGEVRLKLQTKPLEPLTSAAFLRNVVDVYPIGIKK